MGLSLGALNAPVRSRMKRLESAMLSACRAAGASAWYVPDDYLTLGPEQVVIATAEVAGTSGYFYSDFSPVVGKSYQVTYEYSVTGGTSVQVSLGGSNVPSSTVGSGSVVYAITATNTNPLRCYSNAATATLSGISVREILSAKDFQDSAGTLPTYLSGAAGMVFDVAGVTGPELIANPNTSADWVAEGTTPPTAVNGNDTYLGKDCRSVTFPVIASGGYTICRARDAENTFNVVIGTNYMTSVEYALSRDLTAGESVAVAITGSSGVYSKNLAYGALGGVWLPASGGQPALASGGGTSLRPYAVALNAPLTVYVRALSVKVAGGKAVTQATAGNRPVVSRIPRKLGPELIPNGDFGNGASGWSANSATIDASSGACVVNVSASNGRVERAIVLEPGKTYAASAKISSASTIISVLSVLRGAPGGYSSLGFSSSIPAGTDAIASLVFTAPASDSLVQLRNNSGLASGTITTDDISIREVLEWSYALTFDGSNDSLASQASVIGATLAQPYTMAVWGKVGAYGATVRCVAGDSARMLGISTVGKVTLGHGGVAFFDSSYTATPGELIVMEATYNGTDTLNIVVNGVQVYNATAVNPPSTASGLTTIGQRGNASSFWNEQIGGAVICPSVMTDDQRLAVRKFAAAQMGLTL